MPDALLDFYTGFEGEPELLLFLDGTLRLRCWEGYLYALLDTVAPEQGRWTGLAEGHHLDLWGDGPWQVPNTEACLTQLRQIGMDETISADLAGDALEVKDALIKLFQEAVSTGAVVTVRCD
jgi:hypothetical protein